LVDGPLQIVHELLLLGNELRWHTGDSCSHRPVGTCAVQAI